MSWCPGCQCRKLHWINIEVQTFSLVLEILVIKWLYQSFVVALYFSSIRATDLWRNNYYLNHQSPWTRSILVPDLEQKILQVDPEAQNYECFLNFKNSQDMPLRFEPQQINPWFVLILWLGLEMVYVSSLLRTSTIYVSCLQQYKLLLLPMLT